MDRWRGILKIPVHYNSKACYRVAASLCVSPPNTLGVPSANAIFFNGDQVEGTGNPVIERLSDLQILADILVSKFGGSINAWVIQASSFNGPFAIYDDFIPSVNKFGEPKFYSSVGFPASTSITSLLSSCLEEVKNSFTRNQKRPYPATLTTDSYPLLPKTYIIGFSKGGTVLNQLVTELSCIEASTLGSPPRVVDERMDNEYSEVNIETQILPRTKERLLYSITDIHYVDVGLNSTGAYLTDPEVINRISNRFTKVAPGIRFVFHGTPRQWCDGRRVWILDEKNKMIQLLENEAKKTAGKLEVHERFYFANQSPDIQMHFEIIEKLDVH